MKVVDKIVYHISISKTDIDGFLSIPSRSLDEMVDKKSVLEQIFEDIRMKYFNECITRLNCLFVCADMDSVYSWLYRKYSHNRTNYYLYILSVTGELQWFNSDHYNRCLIPVLNPDPEKEASSYWNSHNAKDIEHNIESEGLFQGTAKVVKVISDVWDYEEYLESLEKKNR